MTMAGAGMRPARYIWNVYLIIIRKGRVVGQAALKSMHHNSLPWLSFRVKLSGTQLAP